MKKIYSLLLAATAVISMSAQTSIAVSGNTVTFTTKFPTDGFSSTPVNLYSWSNTGDNTAGTFKELFGGWPGKLMTGPDAGGNYTASVDLSTLYAAGTKVNEINFIYNNGSGTQTADLKASANATGWSPVTIAMMAVSEVASKAKSQVAAGKLFTTAKGNLDVAIYDFSGKMIKTMKVNASGTPIDLGLSQKGMYLMTISGANIAETVKFSN